MELSVVHLFRDYSSPGKPLKPLKGKLEFTGPTGEVSINVSEKQAAQIVELCAEGIRQAALEVSTAMSANVVYQPALPESPEVEL